MIVWDSKPRDLKLTKPFWCGSRSVIRFISTDEGLSTPIKGQPISGYFRHSTSFHLISYTSPPSHFPRSSQRCPPASISPIRPLESPHLYQNRKSRRWNGFHLSPR